MKEFRKVLCAAVKCCLDGTGDSDHALLFSGGTDSLTVLWTLLDLGVRPRCYVFRLADVPSADSRAAALAAETWGVMLETVAVPDQALAELARDVGAVVRLIGSSRKTHVEVMWAIWHLFQVVKEKYIWTGLQADTLYGSSRSMAIRYGKRPEEFRAARVQMVADLGQEGLAQAHRLAWHFGKVLFTPYTDEGMRQFMMQFSWQELNRPKQKMPAVLGFKEEFRQAAIYRKNDNLQCGSGVREYMARLLGDPVINRRGRRSIAKLYEDLGVNDGYPGPT